MRAGKIPWVGHQNQSILSVDVQPNGYRFITGGGDSILAVWNLLPVISEEYEMKGQPVGDVNEGENKSRVQNQNRGEDVEMAGVDANSYLSGEGSSHHPQNGNQDDQSSEETNEEDRAAWEQRSKDILKDCNLMASLLPNEKTKTQRLLAILNQHNRPINCVRWNNLGTMFASADDEGTIILWEYRGLTQQNAFQASQFGQGGQTSSAPMNAADAKEAFQEADKNEREPEFMEDWRTLKSWKGHRGRTISDLSWSPDSMHFASCGTDSTICIWNVNEHFPLRVLDQKANGLTFDPFGKFFASQSSEEKKLTVWRVQNYSNLTKEHEIDTFYKSQSINQSLFRRLSWSADGAFISTTGGRVASENIAPLINRTQWNLLAALSGHSKPITVSRINSTLYKQDTDKNSNTGLTCYSVIALASADSTITVWQPKLQKPLVIMMDAFNLGVTDLSWGFNGNILLASSNDGTVMMMHFQNGILGQALQESEKRLIIERLYGRSVLDQYVQNRQCQTSTLTHLSAAMPVDQGNQEQQKQETTRTATGKMKIKPIVTKVYEANQTINPALNPFMGQQLGGQEQMQAGQGSSAQPVQTMASLSKQNDQQKESEAKAQTNSNNVKPQTGSSFNQGPALVSQTIAQNVQPPLQVPQMVNQIISNNPAQQTVQKPLQQSQANLQSAQSNPFSTQNQQAFQATNPNFQGMVPQEKNEQSPVDLDLLNQEKASLANQDQEVTLPAPDVFSEELRVVITNQGGSSQNPFLKNCQIKIYSTCSQEISSTALSQQNVIQIVANLSFFAVLTTKDQISIFSSKSTQLIKAGLSVDACAKLASNGKSMRLGVLTVRGIIQVYKIKEVQAMDSCVLENQCNVNELLKVRTGLANKTANLNAVTGGERELIGGEQQQQNNEQCKKNVVIYVQGLKLMDDGSLVVVLTDWSRHVYSPQTRLWSELCEEVQLPSSLEHPVKTSTGQIINAEHTQKQIPGMYNFSSFLQALDAQEEQASADFGQDIEMVDESNPQREDEKQTQQSLAKIMEFQQALEVYECLKLKQEYAYAYKMLVNLFLQSGDMHKLIQMLRDDFKSQIQDFKPTEDKIEKWMAGQSAELTKGMSTTANITQEGLSQNGLFTRSELFRMAVLPAVKAYLRVQLGVETVNGEQIRTKLVELFDQVLKQQ